MIKQLITIMSTGIGFFSAGSLYAVDQTASLSIPSGVLTSTGIPAAFVAHFALFLSCVLLWTLFWGAVFQAVFRLPIIAGQIIGGILLGPSGVNIRSYEIFAEPLTFIDAATGYVYALASFDLFVFALILISSTLTVSYLLWIAGHETDVRDLIKVGLTATTAGILGALLPIGMTVLAAYTLFHGAYTLMQAIGIGLIFAATSVSIPVAMLVSQKKMHLKSSKATLGAAIIDDVFAVILLSIFFIIVPKENGGASAGVGAASHQAHSLMGSLAYMLFAAVAIFVTGYYIVPRLLRWLEKHHYSYMIASVASGMMLLYFAFAELVGGLAGITGAYFIGLFHKTGDPDHYAENAIAPYVNTFLLPLFLASIGLQLDMRVLVAHQWMMVGLLLIVAIISKLLGCWIATWVSNFVSGSSAQRWSGLETYIFGSSMVARGEVGLVVSTILRGAGLITIEQYTIAVVVIVLTTVATPIMLAIGFSLQEAASAGVKAQIAPYSKNIGLFEHIGADQMFDIMVDVLNKSRAYTTTVQFSEGCRIMTIEDSQVKIIMCPDRGIVVEGDQQQVQRVINKVQEALKEDLQRLSQV